MLLKYITFPWFNAETHEFLINARRDPLDPAVTAPQTALTRGSLVRVEPHVLSNAGLQKQDEIVIGTLGFKEDQQEVHVNFKRTKFHPGRCDLLVLKLKGKCL